MFAELNINELPKTTQQIERLKNKDLKDLLNLVIATIIHFAESEDLNQKQNGQLKNELNSLITAVENKNKNSQIKISTVAMITLGLIELIKGWEEKSEEERSNAILEKKNEIKRQKINYRKSKYGK